MDTFPVNAGPPRGAFLAINALRHRNTGEGTREYAAFLQNAPVVRHTRGFTPGWYAVPRWGTPNAAQPPESPPPPRPHAPSAITTKHRVNDDCFPQRRLSSHPH
jgi:hypothetical protein